MRIISRAEWGARHPRGFTAAPLPAREVWLHHSATSAPRDDPAIEAAAMRQLEQIGQDRFGGGISYTFLVAPSGRIYEGHGIDRQGAHTGGRNSIARAICLIGNYDTARPGDRMLDAVAWLLRHGRTHRWWPAAQLTGGHRDVKATACPGRYAYALIPVINHRALQEVAPVSADAFWDRLIPDRYAPNLRPLAAWDHLGWASAHAAHARDAAREARTAAREARTAARDAVTAVTRVERLLEQLAARPVGEVDPAPIVEAIVRAGIAEQVVDALAARLTQPS